MTNEMNTIDAMKRAKAALQDLIGEHYGDRQSVVSNFGRMAVSDLSKAIAREEAQTATKPPQSNLNDPRLTTILFSVLVKRLGGTVTVAQDDIDAVAYNRLEEEGCEDGTVIFRFLERGRSS